MADWTVISDSSLRHKHYNGGWQGGGTGTYESDLHGGYAGNDGNGKKHCTVIRFKSPVTGTYNLKFTIPFVRSDRNSKMVKEGTFYVKLQSTDITDIDKRPTSSTSGVVTKNWAADDLEVHKVTVYKVGTFKKDSYYYLVINADSIIEVGHTGHDSDWYVGIDTSYHTAVGKGTVTITDNYNNTFTVTATKGANGTNNTASLGTINWGYSTSYGNTTTTGSAVALTTLGTANTRTVYARAYTVGTKGDSAVATTSKSIKQYLKPNAPGKPELKYSKSRLTIKESWKYQWTAATSANTTTSPVKGYRIILYKNGVSQCIKNAAGTALSTQASSGTWYLDSNYKEDGIPTVNIHPNLYNFRPGDKIKLQVKAYTQYGQNNDGAKLLSSSWVTSAELTIQNAGVVRVKAGGAWKEGQVYVKVNGVWKEAETVNTKVSGVWKESQ